MRRFSILFMVFALISISAASSNAQQSVSDYTKLWESKIDLNSGTKYLKSFVNDTAVPAVEKWVDTQLQTFLKNTGGSITGNVTSTGDIITTAVNDVVSFAENTGNDIKNAFSWLDTRHEKGATPQSPTHDSTIVGPDGIISTGVIAGSEFALSTGNIAIGGQIFESQGLGQTTAYTIPDPGASSANFVLDAGNSTIGGNKTFSGTPKMTTLSASQAVVTDGSKNLTSLGYGSTNTASTLVERDALGNFAGGTITANVIGTATITVTVITASVSSNATTLDNTHTYYIVPANSGTSVAITPPVGASGKVIVVENQDATAATTGLAVPAGGVYTFIYNGSVWKHAS